MPAERTEISVLFSGLHGISALVCKYENVLMIASDFGVAAYLPYLKRLIHGYNKFIWFGS
jgi:NAD(P)H-flavin reductase